MENKLKNAEGENRTAETSSAVTNTPSPIETESYLNDQILTITLNIKEKYPELYQYIEEMPVTIPNKKDPEINRKNLKTYLESLKTLLNKYILENPQSLI